MISWFDGETVEEVSDRINWRTTAASCLVTSVTSSIERGLPVSMTE
jgi:hypothetical protein